MAQDFACKCGSGIGSLAVPSCLKISGLSLADIFQNTYDRNSVRNGIPRTAIVDGKISEAYILSMFNNPDPTVRWQITPDQHEAHANGRTDRTTQDGATGSQKVLRDGVKTYTYELWNVPPQWATNLKQGNCNEMSVYKLDEQGNLEGTYSDDGSMFYPLAIEKGSLSAEPFTANDDKSVYVMVNYQLSRRLVKEANYMVISSDEIAVDLRQARGLNSICIEEVLDPANGNLVYTNTATSIFVKAENRQYGTFVNPYRMLGMDDTLDWAVSLKSDGSVVNITDVEEVSDGEYRIDIDSNPSTDLVVDFVKQRTSISDFGFIADSYEVTTPA